MIGYQCPNAARRFVTCMNTKKTMCPSRSCQCALLTTIHPPLQDLRGIKLSQFRNFHYLKIGTKPLYIDIDFLWRLLDPSAPPPPTQSLFLLTHPFILLPLLCLTEVIQFYLLNTYSFSTCGPVIIYQLLCIQYKTPDDGQKTSLKHVEFYSKNRFAKLVHLVGFIIGTLWLCRSMFTVASSRGCKNVHMSIRKVSLSFKVFCAKSRNIVYEGWSFNSGNYLFTTDTK